MAPCGAIRRASIVPRRPTTMTVRMLPRCQAVIRAAHCAARQLRQEKTHMAIKRIKKEQVDAGKKELPRKLAYLQEEKIDYEAVTHNEDTDEWSVEMSSVAFRALARKRAELKELKAEQRDLVRQAALVPELQKDREQLAALREQSEATQSELRKALRRIKLLEKALGIEAGAKPGAAIPVAGEVQGQTVPLAATAAVDNGKGKRAPKVSTAKVAQQAATADPGDDAGLATDAMAEALPAV
ncbi:hypothetical protein OOT46_27780 [Aquabacterium sp. A7-Y]|uniref:hypothetical protein n=1 Tax=Aquabacterium sp. A7-Y TaxID=1349605 RepID=UPI00223D3DE8|nr:hypothetical protein [Aquabacterium sp. A7-Y]MCW7541608.1 hypothetical protein [Aquabacterium sp. A7-Y]